MTHPYIAGAMLDSAIGLVLVETPAQRNAMTVSFFSEVAHHPTALWISISTHAFTHELLLKSKRFSLVVLNNRQGDIAKQCGTFSGRERDKCAGLNLTTSEGGFLILRGALASTGCEVSKTIEIDEHTLFIAHIIESHLDSRQAHRRQLLLSDL